MPKSNETEAEFKSLQELAMQMDSDPDFEPAPAKAASESRPEPVQDDKEEKEPEAVKSEAKAADTAEIEPEDLEPKEDDSEHIRKEKERFAKNWKIFQRDRVEDKEAKARVAAAEERARRAEEEASKLRAKPPEIPLKDRRGYTVDDYEKAAETQEQEGNWQQARTMREEAMVLRGDIFKAEWQANVAKMVEIHPDLANPTTQLNKEVERLLREPDNVYVTKPNGIKAAVTQAKANLDAGSISAMKAENEKLKQELDRLSKLGAIPGRDGAIKRVSNKAFADMSLEEQRAHLLRSAEELDAEAMRY